MLKDVSSSAAALADLEEKKQMIPTPPTLAGFFFCLASAEDAGLYSAFSCDYARSTAANAIPTHAAMMPTAPRWIVSQIRSTSSAYQIPPSLQDAAQVITAAYHASPAESARTIFGSLTSADTLPAV